WSSVRTACASASARASPTPSAPRRRRSAASLPTATTGCRTRACHALRASCTYATSYHRRTRAECATGGKDPGDECGCGSGHGRDRPQHRGHGRSHTAHNPRRATAHFAPARGIRDHAGHPPFPMSMTIARYRFGDYVLDLPKHELLHRGDVVALPARVFECLCCLIEHRDRAVSRDELVQAVFARSN